MALMNLAQSFRVTNRPGGCFTTKVDLYFSQTDATLPVTISIREMRNGRPTQRVVPFSSVTKFPSSTGAPSSDCLAILVPRRGRWTSKIIEILRTVVKNQGFAIFSLNRFRAPIWDPPGLLLGGYLASQAC